MMEWMDLPVVVLENHLFPFLKLNDLLRLRLVCKKGKAIADSYLRGAGGEALMVNNYITINPLDEFYSFGDFVELGFRATRLYLNNENIGHKFFLFDKQDQKKFLEIYGARITHLKIDEFPLILTKRAFKFFNALPNLTHLELEAIEACEGRKKCQCSQTTAVCKHFPETFRKLKSLKIDTIILDYEKKRNVKDVKNFIRFCGDHLEYFGFPDTASWSTENNNTDLFKLIYEIIEKRRNEFPNQPNLKFLDMQFCEVRDNGTCHHIDLLARRDSEIFFNLHKKHVYTPKLDVKLLHVNASLLQQAIVMQQHDYDRELDLVIQHGMVSFTNFQPMLFTMELKDLEKITVDQTSQCFAYQTWNWKDGRPSWPSLKRIEIWVDSVELGVWADTLLYYGVRMRTKNLLKFFFVDIHRPSVTELKLANVHNITFPDEKLAYPKPLAEDIISSCPNLTKLTLIFWCGTNNALSKLWSGLPCLEEVTLAHCQKLGNVAFVGEDTNNPTFLLLKNLKKLTLDGIDEMPKLTDTAFTLVFCKIRLVQLSLSAEIPLKSITTKGILALLNGEFGKSIERFSFETWSLDGVTKEDFKQLGNKFRSSHMI